MTYRKTPIAARQLDTSYHQLFNLIRFNKIKPPERDTSGHYIWTDGDLARARQAIQESRTRKGARA
jgi:hypothetical protein